MKSKRVIALLVVVCMLMTIVPTAFAADVSSFTDFPTGWSKDAMQAAVNNGLLIGVSEHEIQPQANLTRAELAAIVVRAFGAETKADISMYQDVKTSDWYYDYIAKAVQMEALYGKSNTEMAPLDPITREEVFVALARILVLESTDSVALNKFVDKEDISSWALEGVTALAKKGYINGDDQRKLNPKANITREEFAQFMYNMVKVYITEPGTYTQNLRGMTVVRAGDVTFKGITHINDLVIGDGVGTENIMLENVDIEGRLLTRGGTFTLTDTTVSENVVVKNVNSVTNFNNYEDEDVFKDINKITEAKFLEREPSKPSYSGGSSGSVSTTITVRFNVDGTQYAVVSPRRNSAFSSFKPADPTKTGYTFEGWYRNDTLITDNTVFTANATLEAKFVPISYGITYNSSIAFSATVPTDFTVETAVTLPVESDFAPHTGWTFGGWYKDAAYTDGPVTEIPAGTIGNQTFYAKWESVSAVSYYVEHWQQNVEDNEYTLFETDTLTGIPGDQTAAVAKTYQGFTAGTIVQDTINADGTTIIKIYYTRNVYSLTFDANGGTGGVVLNLKYGAPITPPTVQRPGFMFMGWDKTVAATMPAEDTVYTAQWSAIVNKITVTFKLEETDTTSYHTAELEKGAAIGANMPAVDPTKPGYRFDGWFVGNQQVLPTTQFDQDTVIVAKWTKLLTVTFKTDAADTAAYAIVENIEPNTAIGAANMPSNPAKEHYMFLGWKDESGNVFDATTLVTQDMTVIADWEYEKVRVRFFDGYTTDETYKLSELILDYGMTVQDTDIPANITQNGYKKGPSLAPCYTEEYTHQISSQYWYQDEQGKWKIFDDSVVITKDTDVFRMFKTFGVFLENPAFGTVRVSAPYVPGDTRTMDTLKDMTVKARASLSTLMSLPQYAEYREKLMNKLISSGFITADEEIKIVNVPVAITSVISPDRIRQEIKQYITETIQNPAQLDSIFNMVELEDFVNQIGAENLVDMLTDAQILSVIKAPENEDRVVAFIKNSLNDASMQQTITEYLKTLISTDPAFKTELAGEIKVQLAADADLRQNILANEALVNSLFAQESLKDTAVNWLSSDAFLNIIFENDSLKETLIQDLAKDDNFIALLIETEDFENYLVDAVQHETLGQRIKELIQTNETFKQSILDELKNNPEFMELLSSSMRGEVLASLDSYAGKEDVLAYIFGEAGSKDYSAFITETDIQALYQTYIPGYILMTEPEKQAAVAALAANTQARDEIWTNHLEAEVLAYKESVIDDFVNGVPLDEELEATIDDTLISYIIDFIDGNPVEAEGEIRTSLISYVRKMILDVDEIADADIKNVIIEAKDGFVTIANSVSNIVSIVIEFRDSNPTEFNSLIDANYSTITNYIKDNMSDPDIYSQVDSFIATYADRIEDAVILDLIDELLSDPSDTTIADCLLDYINNPANDQKVEEYIRNFVTSENMNESFVHTYRAKIADILSGEDITSFVDENMVKNYINGLSAAEKAELADKIYQNLEEMSYYQEFMASFEQNKESFEINEDNTMFVMAVAQAIKDFSYETIIGMVNNAAVQKILEIMGQDFLKEFFEEAQLNYYNGVVEIVEKIQQAQQTGTPAGTYQYSTSLSFKVNAIEDVFVPVYEKAQQKLIEKLTNANVYYNENPYLQYLVEHDMLDELFVKTAAGETETGTGYKIKNELAYYDYLVKMLIVADDALCWYGDELSQEQFDALYAAVVERLVGIHDRLNEIIAEYDKTGNLPQQLQSLIDGISQLNNLIGKYQPQIDQIVDTYLGSKLNQHFEPTDIMDNDKVQTAVDIMFGMDEPVFTLDTLYDVFYKYDENMQAKLKQLIESGKLKAAIDKFEALDIGKLFSAYDNPKVTSLAEKLNEIKNSGKVRSAFDSIYNILVIVADYGVEPFRIEEDVPTTEDAYEIKIGDNSFRIKRYYE